MIENNKAYNTVARYCSMAERCRFDVEAKLKNFSLDVNLVEQILERLESEGYLNEQRYCDAFVHDKLHFSKWGRLKIIQALHLKKIDKELVKDSVGRINDEEYFTILTQLLKSKAKQTRAKNSYDLKNKLLRFAAGKGFEIASVLRCLNELGDEE